MGKLGAGVRVEGEAFDLPDLSLPWGQDAIIDAVATVNPNTIVVLETGNPVSMPWRDKVKAIVQAWYPGQAGGQAIAEITDAAGVRRMRLLGFERANLTPGASRTVTIAADPRLLATFDGTADQWRLAAGRIALHSASPPAT